MNNQKTKTTSWIEPAHGSVVFFQPEGATGFVELGKVEGPIQFEMPVADDDPRADTHQIVE